MTVFEHALEYIGRGWSVIPLAKGTKVPPKGFDLAPVLSGEVRFDNRTAIEWWSQHDHDIGIVTGKPSGLTVIDVDPRNGGDLRSVIRHFDNNSMTLIETGGGGHHVYCTYVERPSGKSAFPGVDIKSDGGYVVAPPSTAGGGYRQLSYWGLVTPTDSTIFDLPRQAESSGERWVADTIAHPEGVFPGSQEETLTRLCWYAAGHWEQDVAQVILSEWSTRLPLSKEYDPWTDRHVEDRLERAYTKRDGEPQPFDAVIDDQPQLSLLDRALEQTPAHLEAASDPDIDWLCRDFLAPGAFHEVLGVMKEGKTTWLLALIQAARLGTEFLERPTRPIRALYVTEQMGVSLKASLRRAKLQDIDDGFYVLTIADVMGRPWKEFAPEIVQVASSLSCNLLVFDTLSRIAQIEEEDSSSSVSLLNPLIAAKARGIAVAFLRHSRKSGGEVNVAGRGSGAFTGEMDVAIQITAPQGITSDYRYLRWVSRLTEADDLHLEYSDGSYEIGEDPSSHKRRMQSKYALVLDALSATHPIPMTVAELVAATGSSRTTVQRWLTEMENTGTITREPHKGNTDAYLLAPPREVEI